MITTDATNLPRVMNCNGSRLMSSDPRPADVENTIREEGNAAHWLASVVFNRKHTIEELTDRKAPNGVFITPEMAEHVSEYLSTVDRSSHAMAMMEWEYSISGNSWKVNGRLDHFSYDGGILSIDDLKYGYTIVEPEMNWSMIAHAIGYCVTTLEIPHTIVFTVHQPRAPHYDGTVRSWTISYQQLTELYQRINWTLSNLSDTLQTGKHCYKCPAFASCPARQEAELNAIETMGLPFNRMPSDDDLATRMTLISRALEILKQSKDAYETQIIMRLKQGAVIDNYGTKDSYTNREWNEGVTPELIQAITGKDISIKKLPTPKQAENTLSVEIVNTLARRNFKGTKLVRMSADKRAQMIFGKR